MPWCYTTDPLTRFEDCFEICSNHMGEKELKIKLETAKEDLSTSTPSKLMKTTTAMSTTMMSTTMFSTTMFSTTMVSTTTAKTTIIGDAKKSKDGPERITTGISTTKSTSIFTTTAKSSYTTTAANLISNSGNTIVFPSTTLTTANYEMSEPAIASDSKLTTALITTKSGITTPVRSTSSSKNINPSSMMPSDPISVTKVPDFYTTKRTIEIDKLLEWEPVTDKRDKSIATG